MIMHSHRFDPVSAILGVVAALAAVLVMLGDPAPLDGADVGIWLAIGLVLAGAALFPWRRSVDE